MTQTIELIEMLKPLVGKLPDEFISKLNHFIINRTNFSKKERDDLLEILLLLVKE